MDSPGTVLTHRELSVHVCICVISFTESPKERDSPKHISPGKKDRKLDLLYSICRVKFPEDRMVLMQEVVTATEIK